MRLRTNEDKINLPIRVLELVTDDNRSAVKGTNLLNQETVTVYLTTRGKAAENPNRLTIEQLFEGYETESGTYQVKPGGILQMNGAVSKREGIYIAQWPNVVRHDEEGGSVMLCQHGTLISTKRSDGSTFADFFSFHPEESIQADTTEGELTYEIKENAIDTVRPAYLIRVVDDNQRVVDYELHLSVYDKDSQKPLTAMQIADSVTDTASELLERYPGAKLDILPASRFFVPAQNYEKRNDYFEKMQAHFIRDMDGDPEFCARQTLIKCGGDNDQYCNQINIVEPFKDGVDPVLMGGYRHAAREQNTEQEVDRQTCRP